jgi:hypothetical protein
MYGLIRTRCTYVDSTELLHKHDEERALCGATIAADDEEFPKRITAFSFGCFDLKKLISIVHIARSLNLVLA